MCLYNTPTCMNTLDLKPLAVICSYESFDQTVFVTAPMFPTSSYPGGSTCSISSTCCSTFTATSIHTSELPYVDRMCQYGRTQGQLPSYNQSDHCYRDVLLHHLSFSKKKKNTHYEERKMCYSHLITDQINH